MENPKLIDPSMKYYLYNTLQNCHTTRVQVYTTIFNVVVFILFIAFVGGTLYYCYKRKLTPYEKHQKTERNKKRDMCVYIHIYIYCFICIYICIYTNMNVYMP
jgi:uncharacterized membrane protein